MRGVAWALLLVLAFTIPWQYSLDFGAPFGNISRVVALAVLLAFLPALLHAGMMRKPGPLVGLILTLWMWFCCSYLWSIDRTQSLHHLRGSLQDLMIAWFVWELADSPEKVRDLLRAFVAGSWVLAVLTIGDFLLAGGREQIRFVAAGQDPNDVARYLVLALPVAALLAGNESRRPGKLLAASYLPLGVWGALLTASRSGFLAAAVGLAGCAVLLFPVYRRRLAAAAFALPAVLVALWLAIPRPTLERLASIPAEVQSGDLNRRWEIWAAGWLAFRHAPFFGSGAGSFVAAARLAPIDTAHNTALACAVEGGIVALSLAVAIVVVSVAGVARLRGPLRIALATVLSAWLLSSLVATLQENRLTWLLLGLIAVAARLAAEQPVQLACAFPEPAALESESQPGWQA